MTRATYLKERLGEWGRSCLQKEQELGAFVVEPFSDCIGIALYTDFWIYF